MPLKYKDASAVDLDWFWRGWFYTNDHVDISLDAVTQYKLKLNDVINNDELVLVDQDVEAIGKNKRKRKNKNKKSLNLKSKTFDPIKVGIKNDENFKTNYKNKYDGLSDRRKGLLDESKYYYQLDFDNVGGLVMPIILEFTFDDDSSEIIKLPAEIWKKEDTISKVIITDKAVKQIVLDPKKETADVDTNNNIWPKQID